MKKTEEHTQQRRRLQLGYFQLKKTKKNIRFHIVTFEPGSGRPRHCIVTTRDVESEQDIDRIGRLPQVAAIAPMSRLLVPSELGSIKDLRLGAATLKTDLLLIYSIDTRFRVESTEIGPLGLISLGFLPNKKANVTSTASAALYDVRTGFVYGTAEATANEQQRATT